MSTAMLSKIPKRMTLREEDSVTFEAPRAADKETKTRAISLKLYSGAPVDRFFGKIIVDLAGGTIPKKRTPILANHEPEQILGYSEEVENDGRGIAVHGQAVMAMPAAQNMAAMIDGGFTYEASMGFSISKAKFIDEGQEAEVNGRQFRGPGVIVQKWRLIDASVVPSGADSATSSMLLGDESEGVVDVEYSGVKKMSTENKDPIAAFAVDQPAAVDKWRAEGYAKGKVETEARFSALQKQFGERPAFVVEQFAKGADVGAASIAFAEVLKVELAADKAKIADLEAKAKLADGHQGVAFNGKASDGGGAADPSGKGLPFAERAKVQWAANHDNVRDKYLSEEGLAADLKHS